MKAHQKIVGMCIVAVVVFFVYKKLPERGYPTSKSVEVSTPIESKREPGPYTTSTVMAYREGEVKIRADGWFSIDSEMAKDRSVWVNSVHKADGTIVITVTIEPKKVILENPFKPTTEPTTQPNE